MAKEKRVKYAKDRLKGLALVWWNMMQDDRLTTGKKKIVSWEKIKIGMRAQFLPTNYEVQMYQKL